MTYTCIRCLADTDNDDDICDDCKAESVEDEMTDIPDDVVERAWAVFHDFSMTQDEAMHAALIVAVEWEREECESEINRRLREYEALIDQGKGEHCKPGYVRDHIWDGWNGKVLILQEVLRAIRARSNPSATE